tara:strand:+ start:493 stop:942 length:450 start_codon:yes stop_codon:yes gene_type:complete
MQQVRKAIVLLIAASLMAGCADAIPDVPGNEEVITTEWTTVSGEFTVLVEDDNNSTTETVIIHRLGTNNTWFNLKSFNWTATHLSFDIVNNTVIFNNYTFNNDGYVIQDGIMFNAGYAPNYGEVELYFPTFPYDITVNYTVEYNTVNGR